MMISFVKNNLLISCYLSDKEDSGIYQVSENFDIIETKKYVSYNDIVNIVKNCVKSKMKLISITKTNNDDKSFNIIKEIIYDSK